MTGENERLPTFGAPRTTQQMAQFDKTALPPEMVVRPSGIWNSRAPFHTFMKVNKADSRAYELTRLCIERITFDLPIARDAGKTLEEFLVPGTDIARRAWKSYANAQLRRNRGGVIQKPAYGHFKHDLIMSNEILKFSTLVRSITLFESYVNCWLLNYLLCKLELGQVWTKTEYAFARQTSPVHGDGTPPNISKVLTGTSEIADVLGEKDVDEAFAGNIGHDRYSLLDHMFFWLHYRNCLVHNGGLCTPRTFNRHKTFWADCMTEFTRDRFEERVPLTLSFELLHRCRFNIYKAVGRLEYRLREISQGRRGHPWSPAPFPLEENVIPPRDAPAMLVEGDHTLSLMWHVDAEFRRRYELNTEAVAED